MSEVWDLLSEDIPNVDKLTFQKPTFPTRRWGQITTKTSSSEIRTINKCIEKLRSKNKIVIKRINQEETKRFKIKMYNLYIKI